MINVVAIMGRLTYDPELRTTPTGVSVVRFQVAVDRNFQRAGEERKADFIDVTAWRQTAEFVSKYFRKGSMIAVEALSRRITSPIRTETRERVYRSLPAMCPSVALRQRVALPAQTQSRFCATGAQLRQRR